MDGNECRRPSITHIEPTRFETPLEFEDWISRQDWYQSFVLPSGRAINGNVSVSSRSKFLNTIDFTGKTVLDIGCNSGGYSFAAKSRGASRVVGIDHSVERIHQAATLAAGENVGIDFMRADLLSSSELGRFDIVLCFAVLSEIRDIITGLEAIAQSTKSVALIEMPLANTLTSIPKSIRPYLRNVRRNMHARPLVGEFVKHKHLGWVVHPPRQLIRELFCSEFNVRFLGRGVRYDLVMIDRIVNA